MTRILFISSPFGSFFKSIARELEARSCQVWRTVCDGGEFIETPSRNRILFRGHPGEWRAFLQRQLREKYISTIVTFNDTSPRNRIAHEVARQAKVARLVLENGYLRPHWVTFDRDGVNGNSSLPKDPEFYLSNQGESEPTREFPSRFRSHVWNTMKHFSASIALSPFLSFDSRYYGDSIYEQARGYIRQYVWGILHNDITTFQRIAREKTGSSPKKIFTALLQKPGDGQLKVHSRYGANAPFLQEVCTSFASHAPENSVLVVKQHPLDYGVENLPRLFHELVARYRLEGRAYYLRRTSIDILLDYTDGLITINSSGGLMAVQHAVPVKCLGKAIYDMPGLTFQGSLDAFWSRAHAPRRDATAAFVNYLARNSQVNGGFHSKRALAALVPGLCLRLLDGSFAPHHVPVRDTVEADAGKLHPAIDWCVHGDIAQPVPKP